MRLKRLQGVNIIGDSSESIDYEAKEIKLYIFGNNFNATDRERWEVDMAELGLKDTKLTILQSQDDSSIREDIDQIKDMYMDSNRMLISRDETIREKEIRISKLEKDLRRYYDNEVLFDRVVKEIGINYNGLNKVSFAQELVSDFEKIDTANIISVKWKPLVGKKKRRQDEKKIKEWMEARLNLKHIEIRELP